MNHVGKICCCCCCFLYLFQLKHKLRRNHFIRNEAKGKERQISGLINFHPSPLSLNPCGKPWDENIRSCAPLCAPLFFVYPKLTNILIIFQETSHIFWSKNWGQNKFKKIGDILEFWRHFGVITT